MQFHPDMLAYCGLYCEQCSVRTAFLEQDEKHLEHFPAKFRRERPNLNDYNCEGCKGRNLCGPCKIKDCAAPKGIDSCAGCEEFPCRLLEAFETDGIPHHRQAITNLRVIRAHGIDFWFSWLQPPLHCTCGERQSWYYTCPRHMQLPDSTNVYGILAVSDQKLHTVKDTLTKAFAWTKVTFYHSNNSKKFDLRLESPRAEFSSEPESDETQLFNGRVAGNLKDIGRFVTSISRALAADRIPHRFEIYDGQGELHLCIDELNGTPAE